MNRAERIAALELEAERLKARLDTLERQIAGDSDAWLQITTKVADTVAEVYVDKVLAEARQHALAYATVLSTLDRLSGQVQEVAPAPDVADEVAKRRADRLAAARASSG